MKKFTFFVVLICCTAFKIMAQTDSSTAELLDFNLDELVTTPSKVKFTQQESPGIITVITEKDITTQGASDLIDVLKLVPGISFHTDVQGVVGIGMRGIWGHEGKVLVMIDGQEMNESYYGNTAFGMHYDISTIKRIEVVRGPGSSVYGGFAELGVINIITKKGEQLDGIEINTSNSAYNNSLAHNNLSIKAGKKYTNSEFSILGFVGQSQKSSQNYYDVYGKQTSLKNNASANNTNLNVGYTYKNLNVKLIYDSYKLKSPIAYDTILNNNLPTNFSSINAEINYKYVVSNKLTITPKLQYINQLPWNNNIATSATYTNIQIQKAIANIEADYNLSKKINFLVGVESFFQDAKKLAPIDTQLFVKNYTHAAYLQSTIKSNVLNIIIGGRYLYNTIYGSAFSPRIALTKAFEDLHLKLLYSAAFKTPTLANIALNNKIEPENTKVLELECGYKINNEFDITANLFGIKITDPIIYTRVNERDTYKNGDKAGSVGFETVLKWKRTYWEMNINYSYYNTAGLNGVTNYALSNTTNSVLGFANHTANANFCYNLNDNFSINNTLSFVGSRYAYQNESYNAANDTYTPLKIDPTLQWNIYINHKNILIKNLDLGAGINNILNQNIYFAQPYDLYNSMIPAFNRNLVVKVGYKF